MAVGPAPQEHQVVYTTLHFDTPWSMDSYVKADGYKAWKKILAEKPDPATIVDELKKSSLRGLVVRPGLQPDALRARSDGIAPAASLKLEPTAAKTQPGTSTTNPRPLKL